MSQRSDAPPCHCGQPFSRRVVVAYHDGRKVQMDLCEEHARTEFWDWGTAQRYERMAAKGMI